MKKYSLYPKTILHVILLIVVSFIFTSPIVFLLDKDTGDIEELVLYSCFVLMFIILTFFFNKIKGNKMRFSFKVLNFKTILLFLPILLLFTFGIYLPLNIFFKSISMEIIPEMEQSIFLIFGAVFLAPLAEEIIFRGIILEGLMKKYSSITSVIISSVFFMLFHLPWYNMPFSFVMSLFLGWIYIKTQSIGNTIILHSITNIFILLGGVIINFFNNDIIKINNLYGGSTIVIIPVLIFTFIFITFFIVRNKMLKI